jgi:hypothetical protein
MPSPPPSAALRTYAAIRISMVAVIVALGVSVALEIRRVDGCVQRSLSAYYYTPVRSVLVGALIALGVAMIALWGKTPAEDTFLNLAGILALVVAFVPTLDANSCGLPTAVRTAALTPEAQKSLDDALIDANAPAVHNNFAVLLAVLVLVLACTAVGAITRLLLGRTPPPMPVRLGYAATWLGAAVAVLVFLAAYRDADDNGSFFNHGLHAWSAVVLFAFVILAVGASAVEKRIACGVLTRWELTYWVLAAAMAGSALVLRLTGSTDTWWGRHRTFVTEATLIVLMAAFWVVQTVDRRLDDAPRY